MHGGTTGVFRRFTVRLPPNHNTCVFTPIHVVRKSVVLAHLKPKCLTVKERDVKKHIQTPVLTEKHNNNTMTILIPVWASIPQKVN